MWLRNKRTGEKLLLAKYYPSTGWYSFYGIDLSRRFTILLDDNKPKKKTMWGDNDFEINYEQKAEV